MKPKNSVFNKLIIFSSLFILISCHKPIINENQTRRDVGRVINYLYGLTISDKVLSKHLEVISTFLTSNRGVKFLQVHYMKNHKARTSIKELLDRMEKVKLTEPSDKKKLHTACAAIKKHIEAKIGFDSLEKQRNKFVQEIEEKDGFVRRRRSNGNADKLTKLTTEMLNFASLLTQQLQEVVEAIRKLYMVQPNEWLKQHEPSQLYNHEPFYKNKAYVDPSRLRALDKTLSDSLKPSHLSSSIMETSAKADASIRHSKIRPRMLSDNTTETPNQNSTTMSNSSESTPEVKESSTEIPIMTTIVETEPPPVNSTTTVKEDQPTKASEEGVDAADLSERIFGLF